MTSGELREARLDPPVHPTDAETFIEKAFQLIQVLVDNDRDKDAFHGLILLKSAIRMSYPRMQDGKFLAHHALLHTAIRSLVSRAPTDDGAESKLCFRRGYVDLHVNGLTWRQESEYGRRHTWYWDFAAAKRQLNSTFFQNWCHSRRLYDNDEYDSTSESCFHAVTVELLDWLQTKAWSEIRYNVFRTIGCRLPSELTERVFSYALKAEEIEADPRLIFYEPAEPSEFAKMGCNHLHYTNPDKHFKKVRGAEYCCRVVDKDIMNGDHCVDLDDLPRDVYLRISKSLEKRQAQSAAGSLGNE